MGNNAAIGGAQGLTLTTNSTHLMATQATGGGKGATAVTPVIAITIADNDTHATLGSGITDINPLNPLMIGSDGFSASSSLTDSVLTTADENEDTDSD